MSDDRLMNTVDAKSATTSSRPRRFRLSRHVTRTLFLIGFAVLSGSMKPAGDADDNRRSQDDTGRRPRRVVILGFDGVDPRLMRRFMDEGHLPRLKALAEGGTFDELGAANPAQSPVSWASFSVGANPGKTGIFDFLYRVPDTYIPDIALVERGEKELLASDAGRRALAAAIGIALAALLMLLLWWPSRAVFGRRWRPLGLTVLGASVAIGVAWFLLGLMAKELPRSIPFPKARRHGTPFWQAAGHAGHSSCVLQVPVTFPAQPYPNGKLLTGLGTPDLRGTWGTFAVYAESFPETWTDPVNELGRGLYIDGVTDSVTGGKVVHVEFGDDVDRAETELFGPKNFTLTDEDRERIPPQPDEVRPKLTIVRDRVNKRATLTVGARSLVVKEGEWSDWLDVDFPMNRLIAPKGIVRFRLRSVEPFYLYASPINIHPQEPPPVAPISAPPGYCADLVRDSGGYFETLGWAIATNPLKDELINEDEFLEDLHYSYDTRWKVIRSQLAKQPDTRLFLGVMLAPDRAQHMFWRYIDPRHPGYRADAPARYRDAILETYRKMDRIVGETLDDFVTEETDLWVVSDHGFASFRKGFHINSWLVDNGFMTLKDPSVRERGKVADLGLASPFSNVDWSRTKAYSMGLGMVFLNRRGREPQGIIETPEEAERVRREIISGLEAYRDPDDGERVIRKVYRREDIFSGPYADQASDLVLGFEDGYRVSWDSAAGRVPPGVVENNLNKWSGDHCSVDPTLVPGIVVTNRKLTHDDPVITDVARTVLLALGVEPPEGMEGRDLLR